MRTFTAILLTVSAFSLALGVSQPLVRFEHLVFFSRTPSLAEIIKQLWIAGDALLAAIVALFSVVFPAGKILAAHALLAVGEGNTTRSARIRRALAVVSKWSMMDVLLVALLIFAAKTSGLADAFTQPGLWFYGLSVAAAAAATALLR